MDNVNIDLDIDQTKYDECNALILFKDNKKTNSTETKKKEKPVLLSNKKKKRLKKILERKSKKLNRLQLINDLQKFKVKKSEYDLMPSTSVIQTAGRKRINDIIEYYNSTNKQIDNNISGIKKFTYKKLKLCKNKVDKNAIKDLNVIGLEVDSDENEGQNLIDEMYNSKDSDNEIQKINSNNAGIKESKTNIETMVQSDSHQIVSKKVSRDTTINVAMTKCIYVTVNRLEDVQESRLQLPILAEEHSIMEAIMYNPVVIICGETGSGKTTQVPQFLYEGGFTINGKIIGITEPRRVAAISMSKRVAFELNLSNEVSYQIRFEGNVTDQTKIKFMTDGILLKEIQEDFLLRKYSAIVIDEAHERSLYSDILIGFLSRVVLTRHKQGDPLKLIIMSATLRVDDFTCNERLFKAPPPVIKIDSRQYPVSVHFSKNTNSNYLKEAYKKISKIHATLPPGGILVFVTGRKEVNLLCKLLREKFPFSEPDLSCENENIEENNNSITLDTNEFEKTINEKLTSVDLDLYSVDPTEYERTMDDFDYSDNETDLNSDNENDDDYNFDNDIVTKEPLYCLPLYSMLPNDKQSLVFKDPPTGCRLCIVATNVAETSLTIPNVKYVIDTGKIKNKVFDAVTGISSFVIDWTSKASADQRAGRAGRTSAGHCYRLYSSAIFNDMFKKYSDPEILTKPIDDLILQMKFIGIDNVTNFPFPSLPKIESLIASEKRLSLLEALKEEFYFGKKNKKIIRYKITNLGKVMSNFPVNPRYSKMLCLSNQYNLMPYTIAIISGLTVQEIFLLDQSETEKKIVKNVFFTNPNCLILGDLMTILCAIGASNYEGLSVKFCQHYNLRYNAMVEINKLRIQLARQIKQITNVAIISSDIIPPDANQVKQLRQLFLCGFIDHVARRIPIITITEEDENGIVKKKDKTVRNCYQSIELESPVYFSTNSVLFNETPEFVVYHDLFESGKMYMRNIVVIESEWLPIYAAKYCTFSNPLDEPPPRYDTRCDKIKCHRTSTFGPFNWELPAVEVDYPDGFDNNKYRYFAYFLFNGNILKWFSKNSKYLTTQPIVFIKAWAFVQPKVEKVVKTLISNQICTKVALLNKLKTDQKFLLNDYLGWIQETHKDRIKSSWPPAN